LCLRAAPRSAGRALCLAAEEEQARLGVFRGTAAGLPQDDGLVHRQRETRRDADAAPQQIDRRLREREATGMTTYIGLLRGINLAGNKMVAMADLRDMITSLGFSDVKTLLQSGNVVFRGPAKSPAKLEARLEAALEKRLGF